MSNMSDKVLIFDTTLRDGEQSAGVAFSVEQKIEIALQLEKLGVDIIEAGFPCSSPEDLESVQKVCSEVKNAVVCGLARAVPSDIDIAWEAVKKATSPRIHVFINTSDLQIEHQLKKTRKEVLEQTEAMVKHAKGYLADVEFSAMDATRSDPAFLVQIVERAISAGATTINIPDSVGYALPHEVENTFIMLREKVAGIDKIILSFHGHEDLGMSTANSVAAVRGGARQVEGTINGIGERAGNTALEEVIMALATRVDSLGVSTNIVLSEIYKTSKLIERCSGLSIQQNKAVVGKNAFRHSSGIHQDGIIKRRDTWEILDPKVIGVPEGTQLVLGKLSGRNGLRQHLEKLGYVLQEEELKEVFNAFKQLTTKKREIDDRDLESLVSSRTGQTTAHTWQVEKVQVMAGNYVIPSATVTLRSPKGELCTGTSVGTGPVDAVYQAINNIIGINPKLEVFDVKAVTEGIDAQGEVSVKVFEGNRLSIGRDADTDIIVASAKAYVQAIGRIL
jgi:2-isopropylmalate synthase